MVFLKVPKMNCGGCVASVEKAVKGVDANAVVKADLAAKTVTVETNTEAARISEAVKAAGYDNEVAASA